MMASSDYSGTRSPEGETSAFGSVPDGTGASSVDGTGGVVSFQILMKESTVMQAAR